MNQQSVRHHRLLTVYSDAAWTPAQLSPAPLLWLEARAGTLFTDAGVTAAVSGDSVYRWVDMRETNPASPVYPYAEQATALARPAVATNGAGLVVRGNGTSQYMVASPTVAPNPATVCWAGKITGPDAGRPWALGLARSPFERASNYWFYNQDTTNLLDTGLAATSLAVMTYRLETGVANLPRQNGANGAAAINPQSAATNLYLFGDDAMEFGACDLASLVVVPSVLSDAANRLLEDYLNSRPGVGVY